MRNRDTWVVDASVSVKWYLRDEELASEAMAFKERYLLGQLACVAPCYSAYEVGNALVTATRLNRFPGDRVGQELEDYTRLGITPRAEPGWLIADGAAVALDLQIAIYDALYIALADRLEGTFLTADRKVYDAVSDRLTFVHWLGDIQA